MSAYRAQAHLDAPLEDVWELVGNPATYPEWWPAAVEIRGESFEVGDVYTQVVGIAGRPEYSRVIDRSGWNLRGHGDGNRRAQIPLRTV